MTKRLYFLLLFFLFICLNTYAQQPWVYDNAHWKYYFEEHNLGGGRGIYETYKIGNTEKLGVLCDELVTKKQYFEYDNQWYPTSDTIIVDTNYTYKSFTGDTIFWLENEIFQILYDFSKEVNESWIYSVSEDVTSQSCNDTSVAHIDVKDIFNLGDQSYRSFEIYNLITPQQYLLIGEFNERFGLNYGESYIFPVKYPWCWSTMVTSATFELLCFEDDSLSYDLNCNFLLELKEFGNSLKVSPNPFHSSFSINGINYCENLFITDLWGNTIREFSSIQELNSSTLEDIESGVYFLKIQIDNEQKRIIKLIKN